jgi:hypothetical protein
MKKFISYSLFGTNKYYYDCALICANDNIFSDYKKIFFIENLVENVEFSKKIESLGCLVINIDIEDTPIKNGVFWRFLAYDNLENGDIILFRDVDSPPSIRELNFVNEWINSSKQFHIIRDGCNHLWPIMAGMFGIKKSGNFSFYELITNNIDQISFDYLSDQIFLSTHIYPLTINNSIVHDSYNNFESYTINTPKSREFIGKSVNKDLVTNGKIYFHNIIDLYKSEQLTSFLYEFCEYIKIARSLGRQLVLPNVLLAPRNNTKILENKEININSLSLIPISQIIDIDVLNYNSIETISLTEFYKTSGSTILITTTKNIVPLTDTNELFTPFGNIPINTVCSIDDEYYGLNILNWFNSNSVYNSYENIVVLNNGRLGQPNWTDDFELIRYSINYRDYYKKVANKFINRNIIGSDTLLVHWRRGDRVVVNPEYISYEEYSDDTLNYYREYCRLTNPENLVTNIKNILNNNSEIKKIFLATNNANKTELEYVYKSINIPILINTLDTNKYILGDNFKDIVEQLIGSRCKYQLHGPTDYSRMSLYGRWMIEESCKYYFDRSTIFFIS